VATYTPSFPDEPAYKPDAFARLADGVREVAHDICRRGVSLEPWPRKEPVECRGGKGGRESTRLAAPARRSIALRGRAHDGLGQPQREPLFADSSLAVEEEAGRQRPAMDG
jgi:hypothetical protein